MRKNNLCNKFLNYVDLFVKIAEVEYKSHRAYNLNFIFMILGNIITPFFNYFIWIIVFNNINADNLNGFKINEVFVYIFLTFIITLFVCQNADFRVSQEIKDGSISISFTKPINYFVSKWFVTLGSAIFYAINICSWLMIFVFVYIIYLNNIAISLTNIILFIISILNSLFITFIIDFMFGLFSIVLMNNWGISKLKAFIFEFMSGNLIPMFFLPGFIQNAFSYLPFFYISYLPTRIFMNKLHFNQALLGILMQFLWIGVLLLFSQVSWMLTRRKLVVNGG